MTVSIHYPCHHRSQRYQYHLFLRFLLLSIQIRNNYGFVCPSPSAFRKLITPQKQQRRNPQTLPLFGLTKTMKSLLRNQNDKLGIVRSNRRSVRLMARKKKTDDDNDDETEYEFVYEEDDGTESDDDEDVEYEYEEYYEEEEYEEENDDKMKEENEDIPASSTTATPDLVVSTDEDALAIRNTLKDLNQEEEFLDSITGETVEAYINNLTPEQKSLLDEDEFERELDKVMEPLRVTESDVENYSEEELQTMYDAIPDDPDPFPEDSDGVYPPGITKDTVVTYDKLLQKYRHLINEVNANDNEAIRNVDMIDDDYIMERVLDDATRQEILNLDCYVGNDESGRPDWEQLHEQRKRLIFDLDYNITNIFLASMKVNVNAPIILDHWFPQLRNWTRYQYVRDNDFNFTWTDVHDADVEELERYWYRAGMDEIPRPTVQENPNVIEWDESPLTFEDEKLLALEQWWDDVYHDDDDINLDDEDFMPEDNPAAPGYGRMDEMNPDPILKDVADFEEKYSHMPQEWRDRYVKKTDFEVEEERDDDSNEFRGHLVIACGPTPEDLHKASDLTDRMDEEFGKKIHVETRVLGHAKPEDHLYEIWLESYEVDLLYSQRRAVFQRDWEGPQELTTDVVDNMVKKIDFLISDDSRFSYRHVEWPDYWDWDDGEADEDDQ